MGNKISTFGDFFQPGHMQIVIVGLDNAGKSTILYRLKLGRYVTTMPTIGFNCEKIRPSYGTAKGISFSLWDVGGQDKIRPLWKSYIRHTHAILFVVDSSDEERFEEAKVELSNLIRSNEISSQAPIVLLANKQDLPLAKSKLEIEKRLTAGQENFLLNGHSLTVVPCCAVSGDGLDDFFDLIYDLIIKSRKSAKMKNKSIVGTLTAPTSSSKGMNFR
uniref:Uncharacterized protein n=1 Tax=Romanomermis culicivorax TaxID=13658 RepID=A0A915IQB1_ROMCU